MRIAYVLPDPVDPGGDPCGQRSIHSDNVTLVSFLTILLGDESGRAGDGRLIPTDVCESCDVTGDASAMDGGSILSPLAG
jgi:hypothetical protein